MSKQRKLTAAQRRELAEKRHAAVVALRDRLGQWQENTDPDLVAAIIARFSDYSARNAQLIALQHPEATEVHGFRDWLAYGRVVNRGEHGIQILAPAGRYRADDDGHLQPVKDGEQDGQGDGESKDRQFFKIAYVFDRSQTRPLDEAEPAGQEVALWPSSRGVSVRRRSACSSGPAASSTVSGLTLTPPSSPPATTHSTRWPPPA